MDMLTECLNDFECSMDDDKKEQIIDDYENIIEQCQGDNNDEDEVTKRLAECMEDKNKWHECILESWDEIEKEDEDNE